MAIEWGRPWDEWKTPELILRDWRARLERLAEQEGECFARLPGVLGVALIGTVPRGTAWPLSDVDILTVVEPERGADVESWVCAEEARINRRLAEGSVPNEIEARYWVRREDSLRSANATEGGLFEFLARPNQAGIAFKAPGGRAVADFEGQVCAFIGRCERVVFGRRFVHLCLDGQIGAETARLAVASELARAGQGAAANALALLAAHEMTAALHLLWRSLPESLSRAVTRMLGLAAANEAWIGEAFLTAAGLTEEETARRFEAAPVWAACERDVLLAVRCGAGEEIGELDVTRDLLHVTSYLAARGGGGQCPLWLSARNTLADARERLRAARSLVEYLTAARDRLEAQGLDVGEET